MLIFIYFKVLAGLLLIYFLGAATVNLITRGRLEFNFIEFICLSYALGSGILTSLILFMMALNLSISFLSVLVLISVVVALESFVMVRFMGVGPAQTLGRPGSVKHLFSGFNAFSAIEKGMVALICLKFTYVLMESMIKPVFSWDATDNHSLRAKILFLYPRDIIGHFLSNVRNTPNVVYDYPMQRAILESWFFKCMGAWNDQLSKIIFPLMFMTLVIFFYFVARRIVPRAYALLFTLLLSTMLLFVYHATAEYSDLSVCYYFSFAAMYLYLWILERKQEHFYLSAVFAGVLPTVKAEGLPLMLILYLICFASLWARGFQARIGLARFSKYFVFGFVLYIWWFIFKLRAHLKPLWQVNGLTLGEAMSKGQAFVRSLYGGVFIDANWNLAFFLLLLLLLINIIFNHKALLKRGSIWLVSITALFFVYVSCSYVLSNLAFDGMGVSINRVCLSVIPLILLLIADQFYVLKTSLSETKEV